MLMGGAEQTQPSWQSHVEAQQERMALHSQLSAHPLQLGSVFGGYQGGGISHLLAIGVGLGALVLERAAVALRFQRQAY